MSTATKPAPAKQQQPPPATNHEDYKIPPARLGGIVLWYEERTATEPTPAFVAKINDQSLDLAVLVPGVNNFLVRTACRWRRDPRKWPTDAIEEGCWDFATADATSRDAAYQSEIEQLHEAVTELKLRIIQLEQAKK